MTGARRGRPAPARTLIVNADDLGMSDAINRGIVAAHHEGIVTSTTAMTNLPHAHRGIALAQGQAPALGIGLHVNLSYGRPVSPPERVSSLVLSDGRFLSLTRGVGLPQHWNRRDIETEVKAQLDRFVAYAGRLPDHLDAHQMVSTLSIPCRAVVLEVAAQYDLPVRRSRTTWFGPLERLFPRRRALPEALAGILDWVPRPWRQGPMRDRTPLSTDGLELRFFGENATVETLLRILGTLPEGVTELVCHPGYASAAGDAYRHRATELAALTDPRVHAKVATEGIALATFGELMRPRQQV